MIVYEETKKSFLDDLSNGLLVNKLIDAFYALGIRKAQHSEVNAWRNSLHQMGWIMLDERIHPDVKVAIEFQIPRTSKRIDFMVGGKNNENDNVVIVELKQWESCETTEYNDLVNTFINGSYHNVVHPSYQAYTYAKMIQEFNESVYKENINVVPCAYLHNYEKNKGQICNAKYANIIRLAPVFLETDGENLKDFLVQYVPKPSNKNLFELIDHGKLKPSKSLQDLVGSILNGNKEFTLIDEQKVAYSTILMLVDDYANDNKKHTVIIKGGPGTGKSVIAINLLAKMIEGRKRSCLYVTKNSAPRSAFSHSFIKGKHELSFLKGLFKPSTSFYDVSENAYDCLIVDEAHRLNEKTWTMQTGQVGENQIKEIINAAKISIFFVDEDQIVTTKDIGTINNIIAEAKKLNSQIHQGFELKSQFRCNGSDGYLAFLDDVLDITETANGNFFDLDYDIQVFDDPNTMKDALKKTNIRNKSRMIAGYCYPWNSKKDKTKFDIFLENGFKAQWNFTTDRFAIDENSFDQVGCIYSTQGIEFDYVGVIIGLDLRYENNKVITDAWQHSSCDRTIGITKKMKEKNDDKFGYKKIDKLIKNIYKTLLSRGQKGCYVYCEDKALSSYLKQRISKAKELKNKLMNK